MPTTPIARSKTAALARVLDNVPRGYVQYTCGTVAADAAEQLASKFHRLHGIGASPAQRITAKKYGRPSALLVMYLPEGEDRAHWLLLFTAGNVEGERLCRVTDRNRLQWLGYELARRSGEGKTIWTWRRPKSAMAEWYGLLADLCNRHNQPAIASTLQTIANQPGFNGIRSQSWELIQFARSKGYSGEIPFLFYVHKVSHGDRLALQTS